MIPGLGSLGLSQTDIDGPASASGSSGPVFGDNNQGFSTAQMAIAFIGVAVLILVAGKVLK